MGLALQVLDLFVIVVGTVFLLAFTLYLVRVFRGPTVVDSVLAIDCLTFDLAVFLALLSLLYRTPFLAFGALLLVLWAFVFDLFIARYLLRRRR